MLGQHGVPTDNPFRCFRLDRRYGLGSPASSVSQSTCWTAEVGFRSNRSFEAPANLCGHAAADGAINEYRLGKTVVRAADAHSFRGEIPADAFSVSMSLNGMIVRLMKGEDGRSEGSWCDALCSTVPIQDVRKELDRDLAFYRKNQRRMRCATLADKAMGIAQGPCRPTRARETQRRAVACR